MNEIIVNDICAQLKKEIAILKMEVTALIQEKSDLEYHICPELNVLYMERIGDLKNRIMSQELMIREMRFRIEKMQAAINREEEILKETIDEEVENEYKEYHEKVNEEFKKAEEAKEERRRQEEKQAQNEERHRQREEERQQREEWRQANGGTGEEDNYTQDSEEKYYWEDEYYDRNDDDDSYTNATSSDDEFSGMNIKQKVKELYRRIVKKLHPDVNPDITEHEKELLNKATEAYRDGDINTLEDIYDEITGYEVPIEDDSEETLEKLQKLKDHLILQRASLIYAIKEIKESFPYSEKDFLENDEAVVKCQEELKSTIAQYEQQLAELSQRYVELEEKMEDIREAKRKKWRDNHNNA